jgi:hypothetical protein
MNGFVILGATYPPFIIKRMKAPGLAVVHDSSIAARLVIVPQFSVN